MRKPSKPNPDFPLYAHASGKWAKKVGGKLRYFGTWADPDTALADYQSWRSEYDERTRVPTLEELRQRFPFKVQLSLGDAVALFLSDKQAQVEKREISQRTHREHRDTCSRLVEYLGDQRTVASLTPADFCSFRDHRGKTLNLVSLGNEVTRVKTLFRWLYQSRYLKEPMHFGPTFKKPTARALRRHKRESGKKLFSQHDILMLIHEAGTHLRAMIYLGINCGFGPNDCCQLPLRAINLESGWIDFPRPKTEVDRLCPLWPETIDALRSSQLARTQLGNDTVSPENPPSNIRLNGEGEIEEIIPPAPSWPIPDWKKMKKGDPVWVREVIDGEEEIYDGKFVKKIPKNVKVLIAVDGEEIERSFPESNVRQPDI